MKAQPLASHQSTAQSVTPTPSPASAPTTYLSPQGSADTGTDNSAHSYVLEMMSRSHGATLMRDAERAFSASLGPAPAGPAPMGQEANERGLSFESQATSHSQTTPRSMTTPFASLVAQLSGLSSDAEDAAEAEAAAQMGEGEDGPEGRVHGHAFDSVEAAERVTRNSHRSQASQGSHGSSRQPSLPPVDELRAQLRRMRSDMPPRQSAQPSTSNGRTLNGRAYIPHPRLAMLGTNKATRKDSPIVPNDNADDPMAKFRDYRQQIGTRSAQSLEQQNRLPLPRQASAERNLRDQPSRRPSREHTTHTVREPNVRRVKPTPTVVRAPAISPTDRADSSKVDISIELPPSVAPTLARPEGDTVRARLTRRRRRLPLPWVIGFGLVSSCALAVGLTGLAFTLYNFSKLRQNRAQKSFADLEADLKPILANMTNGITAVQAGINILLSADAHRGG